ncbi:MAG TPA: phosphatase domain-containing protein [Pyrinomonadaceae bacterium]|nr:phosphatase domain-containing protein [Pyrinomonadaceae bacterium]
MSFLKDKIKDGINDLKEGFNERFSKEVVFYSTYGYQSEGAWVIPMRVWVRRTRPFVLDDIVRLWPGDEQLPGEAELTRFGACSADFVADDCGEDRISFTVEGDPDQRTYRLGGVTNVNGLLKEDFVLPAEKAERLMEATGSRWLTLRVKAEGQLGDGEGRGRVQLLEPEGLSVVSDIDDTIRVTEILAGFRRVTERTFFMEYESVKGMADRYRDILAAHPGHRSVAFHYVSGGPWPLYRLLYKFLIEQEGFPEGSFHMKDFDKSLRDPATFRQNLRNYAEGSMNTQEMKEAVITSLMTNLPGRRFVLFGDSGERDPEAFRAVRDKFRERVEKIYIRDVKGEGAGSPRLDGMEPIPV